MEFVGDKSVAIYISQEEDDDLINDAKCDLYRIAVIFNGTSYNHRGISSGYRGAYPA